MLPPPNPAGAAWLSWHFCGQQKQRCELAVVEVNPSSRHVEEDVAFDNVLTRLGLEPRRRLFLEVAELVDDDHAGERREAGERRRAERRRWWCADNFCCGVAAELGRKAVDEAEESDGRHRHRDLAPAARELFVFLSSTSAALERLK